MKATEKKPTEKKKTDLEERLSRSAEAKKALIAKFRAKPTVSDPAFVDRAARRAAELQAVREARAAAKEAVKQAKVEVQQAVQQVELDDEDAEVAAKRAERKARKAQAKAEAQAKKEARTALRKPRQEAELSPLIPAKAGMSGCVGDAGPPYNGFAIFPDIWNARPIGVILRLT